jgi:chromosome segregation ATPase
MLTIAKPPGMSPETEARLLVLEPVRWAFDWPTLLLTPGRHTLGSAEDCTTCLRMEGVEPRHCLIDVRPHRAILEADSLQTWHNDAPVKRVDLRAGDWLTLGSLEFRVRTATQDDLGPDLDSPSSARTGPTQKLTGDFNLRAIRQALVPSRRKDAKPRIIARAFGKREEHPIPGEALADLRDELQSLQNQAAGLRRELLELDESKLRKTAEFEAIEPLLAEETKKIREELAREQCSLAMESTLLREQRQRMEIRERALNAQRRELEDSERHVTDNLNAQEAERAKLDRARQQAKTKLADLNRRDSDLQSREADRLTRESLLKAQQAEFEMERQDFLKQRADARKSIERRESECARLEAELKRLQEEIGPAAGRQPPAETDKQRELLARERGLFKISETLIAESALLEATHAAIIEMQVRLESEQKQLAQDRNSLNADQEELRDQDSTLARRRADLEASRRELEEWEEQLRSTETDLEDQTRNLQMDRDWLNEEHAAVCRLRLQATLTEAFGRSCEEHYAELIDRLSLREVGLDEAFRDVAELQEKLEQDRSAQAEQQDSIDRQQAVIEVAMQEITAAKLQINQLLAEQIVTTEERIAFEQAQTNLLEKQRRVAEQQKKLNGWRNQLHAGEAELLDRRQALFEESLRLEQEWQRVNQEKKEIQELRLQLESDSIAMEDQHASLMNRLSEREQRLKTDERDRRVSIEKLTEHLAELEAHYSPAPGEGELSAVPSDNEGPNAT